MSDTPVPPSAPEATPAAPVGEDKTNAILAYVTPLLCLVGIVIAIVMHNSKKTKLGSYHLRQSLGLVILCVANGIFSLIPFIGLLAILTGLGIFVLWVMGLLNAINGQIKPIPVVGEKINELLGTTFE